MYEKWYGKEMSNDLWSPLLKARTLQKAASAGADGSDNSNMDGSDGSEGGDEEAVVEED